TKSTGARPFFSWNALPGMALISMSYWSYSNSRPELVISSTPGLDLSGTGMPAACNAEGLFEKSDRYSSRSHFVRRYIENLLWPSSRFGSVTAMRCGASSPIVRDTGRSDYNELELRSTSLARLAERDQSALQAPRLELRPLPPAPDGALIQSPAN